MSRKIAKAIYSVVALAMVLGSVFAFSAPKALAAPAYDYQFITQSAYPATLAPGAVTNVWMEVKNTGTATWGSNVRLGAGSAYGSASQQRDYSSEFANSDWPSANRAAGMTDGTRAVAGIIPGWNVRYQFNIKAPMTAGVYKAYFTPVADGITWMKDIGIYWQITVTGNGQPDNGGGTVVPPVGSAMSVALSTASPAAASIPSGARGVAFSKFAFTGGSSDSTITNLTVKRIGAGAASDFDNVYLYDGDTRLTNGRSVNSSTGEVTFTGFSAVIPANSTKVLTISADVKTIAGGAAAADSNAFEIESAAKIVGATFGGSFPIAGNAMTITSAAVGSVTVSKSGSITDPKIGDQGVKIAEFKVAAATEDVTLRRIALTNLGSISSANITSLSLKQNGTEVASASSLVKDIATFVFGTPMSISNGSDKIFQVYANVTGRPGDTIKIAVDNDADVFATGNTYGYGVGVIRTAYDNSVGAADASWSTLQGGTITVTSSGPAATDIGRNINDQVFMNFAISSGVNAEVRSIAIVVNGSDLLNNVPSPDVAYFKDIKISDGSTIVAGPKELTVGDVGNGAATDLAQTLTFTDRFTLAAGQTKNLTVTMDVATDAPNLTTASITLNAFGATDIKSLDTNDYVTDIVPSTATVGKTMTIKTSGLAIQLAAAPITGTAVKGTSGVAAVGFLFNAASASAATITSIKLTGYVDGDTGTNADYGQGSDLDGATTYYLRDNVSSVTLVDDAGASLSTTKSVATDGTVIFSGLNIAVPAGSSKKVIAKVDLASPATPASRFYFDIVTAASDVTSQDSSANDITETGDGVNAGAGTVINIAANGTIGVALSASNPTTGIIQGGSTVDMLKLKFSASTESYNIQEMRLVIMKDSNGDNIAEATAADLATDFSTIAIYDGSTLLYSKGSSYNSENVDFTGMTINIPKDGIKELTIKATLAGINTNGTNAKDVPAIALSWNTGFKATGVSSGVSVASVSAADKTGNIMVLKKTKPTITTAGVSGTLAGNIDVYRFTLAAGSGSDVSLKQFRLNLSATFNAGKLDGFSLVQDGNTLVAATDYNMYDDDGLIVAAGNGIETSDTFLYVVMADGKELNVSANASSTIAVKATSSGTGACTVTALLAAEATAVPETAVTTLAGGASAFIWEVGAADDYIVWSDNALGNLHSATIATSDDWANGFGLKNLPGATFSYSRS